MTPDEYQSKAAETALWLQLGEGVNYEPLEYCVLGLASEAGEVAGVHKKWLRDDTNYSTYCTKMRDELGDVLWYVAMIAQDFGWSLEAVMQANLDKLAARKASGTIQGSGDNR